MKKMIALLLAVMMVMAMFTGCGSKEEAAATAYKLGGVGPLTGGAAIYGNAAQNGATIAVEEINALGGDIQSELK